MKTLKILNNSTLVIILCLASLASCKQDKTEDAPTPSKIISTIEEKEEIPIVYDYDTTQWLEISEAHGAIIDIRYATDNNFTKNVIYPCDRCFLRPALAKKMIQLQKDIHSKYGWSLKFLDCYRPKPAQQKLWNIVPDARYVTPPHKGSMHTRGLAVDLTIVDKNGNELDMGTEYDYFGVEAHTDNRSLSPEILKNRDILKALMEIHGLKGIRTEWWHFSLKSEQAQLDTWEWPCE